MMIAMRAKILLGLYNPATLSGQAIHIYAGKRLIIKTLDRAVQSIQNSRVE
jgi:hypothetical protein